MTKGQKKGTEIKLWHVALISLAVFVLAFAAMTYLPAANIQVGGGHFVVDNNGDNVDDNTGEQLQIVNRAVTFTAADFFNGSQGSGTLTTYKEGSDQPYETLTLASGSVTSSKPYQSNDVYNILYNDGSNSKLWINGVVIPKMAIADQYQANNKVSLDSFMIGTYSSDSLTVGATGINDAGSYNSTTSGTTPTFSYKLTNTGSTNTGLMESNDPTTDYAYDVYLLVKLSGTGAETISMTDGNFDDYIMIGTTQYGWIHLDPNQLTTWKDSLGAYKYNDGTKCTGIQTIDFNLDLTGYSGTAVTMQITAYAYFDPQYLQDKNGAIPSSAYSLAEQTVTLTI